MDPLYDNWWRHLWAYVEIGDAVRMTRLAVETDGLGFDVFHCTAADTLSDRPTEEMISAYTPSVELRRPIRGKESAFSTEKAERILGYRPTGTWRTVK